MPERDRTAFEARLGDAFDRLVAPAPVEVDARVVAALAAQAPRRASRLAMGTRVLPLRGVMILGLITVLIAAAAIAAGAMLRRPPTPLGGGGNIMVFAKGSAHVFDTKGTVLATRAVATRFGCPALILAGDGVAALSFGGTLVGGIEGTTSDTKLEIHGAGGEFWSQDGRVFVRLTFTEGVTFTTFPDGPAGRPADVRVSLPAVGAEGTDTLTRLSPDGSTLAILTTRPSTSADAPAVEASVLLIDSATGVARSLGDYPMDADMSVRGMTWSLDSSRVGFVVQGPRGSATASIIQVADGSVRSIDLGPVSASPELVSLAPDGSRAMVTSSEGIEIRDVGDGRTIARVAGIPELGVGREPDGSRGWGVAWGPDGRSFAWVGHLTDGSDPGAGGRVLHVQTADGGWLRDIPIGDSIYAWSPDRTAVAVVGSDQRLDLYFPWSGDPSVGLATVDIGGFDEGTCIAWAGDMQRAGSR
jgi:hypothetical protein